MELNQFIAKFTQLLSESIAFFFLLLPFIIFSGFEYPYWSYLLLSAMIIILFDVCLTYLKNYLVYLPILGALFIFMVNGFHYPILPAIVWLGFMTWRNIRFDKHGPQLQPFALLMITTILLLIGIMFFYDSILIWFGVTQIGLIVGGTWLRLLFGTNSIKSMQFLKFFCLSALILLAGSMILYGVYPLLRGMIGLLLAGVGFVFEKVVIGIVGLLAWLGLDLRFLEGIVDEKTYQQVTGNTGESMNQLEDLAEVPPVPSEGFDIINGWTITIFLIFMVIFAGFLAKKSYRKVAEKSESKPVSSIEYSSISRDTNHDVNYLIQSKPENPFRRKVFEFEQEAKERGLGRHRNETIEEWFKRLNLKPENLNFYQKIRYGEMELTNSEEEQASFLLKELRNWGNE